MTADEPQFDLVEVTADPAMTGALRTVDWVLREFGKRWTEHDREVVVELIVDYGVDQFYAPPSEAYVTCTKVGILQFWIIKGRVSWADPEDPKNAEKGVGVPPENTVREVLNTGGFRHYLPLSTVMYHDTSIRSKDDARETCTSCNMVHAVAQTECE